MNIIDGKQIAAALKEDVAARVAAAMASHGRAPHLVVIRVGEDPASVVYVRNKEKACEAVGIRNTTIVKEADTPEEELLGLIRQLNEDPSVDGILIQLPLPKPLSEARVIETIAREKDVDGFHPIQRSRALAEDPAHGTLHPQGHHETPESHRGRP